MNSLMIQNFITNRKSGVKNNPDNKVAYNPYRNFNYKSLKSGASVLPPQGKLVKGSLLGIGGLFNYSKNIKKGYENEVSDYKLGKFNDVAMRTTAFMLAGYLALQKAIPVKKGMEFVGAGAFFASMALFPKIFIEAPVRLKYGFNPNQKWQDSKGRIGYVHRDPNYTPWDLYSPEYLNEVGDRMGVPKDMENREILIKDKMKKISIQSNTLWMLTAGFATPIAAALLASQLEDPLAKSIIKGKTLKVDNMVKSMDSTVDSQMNNYQNKKFSDLLSSKKGEKVDNKLINDIMTHLETDDLAFNKVLKKDVESVMGNKQQSKVIDLFDKALSSNVFKELNITKVDIENSLTLNGFADDIKLDTKNIEEIKSSVLNLWSEKVADISDDVDIAELNESFKKELDTALKVNTQNTLEDNAINKLTEIEKSIKKFNLRHSKIHQVLEHYIGQKEDSVVAWEWKRATKKIFKALKLNTKELDVIRSSSDSAYKVLDQKFERISGNNAVYNKVLGEVASTIQEFENAIHFREVEIDGKKVNLLDYVKTQSDKMYDELANEMGTGSKSTKYLNGNVKFNEGLMNYIDNGHDGAPKILDEVIKHIRGKQELSEHTAEYLKNKGPLPAEIVQSTNGKISTPYDLVKYLKGEIKDISVEEIKALEGQVKVSAKKNFTNMVDRNLEGSKNTLYKFILGLDLYKRLDTAGETSLEKTMKDWGKNGEEALKQMKRVLFEGTIGDFAVKFDIKNPSVFSATMGNVFVKNNQMHDATQKVLNNDKFQLLNKDLSKTVGYIRKNVVNLFDKFNPSLNLEASLSPEAIQNMAKEERLAKKFMANKQAAVGEALATTAQKISEPFFNTKKWNRIFAGAGLGLAAITIITPFFFGKIKTNQQGGTK